eukprot:2405153-Lingulodinium_polyedra.AAC.1
MAGAAREEPGSSREPVTWEETVLIADALLNLNTADANVTAAGCLLQFELYARPGELLRLLGRHVQPPAAGIADAWTVVFFPADEPQKSKTGEQDDT